VSAGARVATQGPWPPDEVTQRLDDDVWELYDGGGLGKGRT
jgi:hypothetical protein